MTPWSLYLADGAAAMQPGMWIRRKRSLLIEGKLHAEGGVLFESAERFLVAASARHEVPDRLASESLLFVTTIEHTGRTEKRVLEFR